jgi:hypothetical protein
MSVWSVTCFHLDRSPSLVLPLRDAEAVPPMFNQFLFGLHRLCLFVTFAAFCFSFLYCNVGVYMYSTVQIVWAFFLPSCVHIWYLWLWDNIIEVNIQYASSKCCDSLLFSNMWFNSLICKQNKKVGNTLSGPHLYLGRDRFIVLKSRAYSWYIYFLRISLFLIWLELIWFIGDLWNPGSQHWEDVRG